jgi:hypothetical protein
MIKRDILIALTTVPAILAPSLVSAQTKPLSVVPTIEFSGTDNSFNFKVTIDATKPFVVRPIVVQGDKFIFNGGTFNPDEELKVDIPIAASINPLGQSAIDATVGNIGISSKTLFKVASGRSDVDMLNFPSKLFNANPGLSVGGDDPILTIP